MMEQILRIFEEKLSRPVDSPDQDLFETGVLDSMALVDLLVEIERSLNVTVSIEDLDIETFGTVRKIAELAQAASLR